MMQFFNKQIKKENWGGQFCLSGYDPSIDYLKGVSILWVLMTHCIPYPVQDALLFSLWGAQAVPLFFIIQVFHSYKKGFDSVSVSFAKLWKRIIWPFLLTTIIIYIIYIGYGLMTHVGFVEQTIKFLKAGGAGAGSYYIWIYLQFVLLLPLIAVFMKRLNFWGNLLLIGVLSELLEIFCCGIHISEWLYRLLFFRYFLLIFIGYYIVKKQIKFNLPIIFVTLVCATAILVFQYGDVNFEPFFFKSDWKSQHWVTYGYDLFVIYVLTMVFRKTEKSWTNKLMQLFGRYSYEIFLWQMIYFLLPIQPLFTKILGNVVGVVLYVLLSLVVCTMPVLYVKNKKELIQLWNIKK